MDGLLIYGAYGYSGELATRHAVARGLNPVLAGRDRDRLAHLAETLGLEHRVFPLTEPSAIRSGLRGIAAVLHCAGPFSGTAEAMVEACIDSGTHYVDITGEVDVIEAIARRGGEAAATNTTLLPSVGFDVVPSDCLAAHVVKRMGSATRLVVAIDANTTFSHGTALTAVENLGRGTIVRKDGDLVERAAFSGKRDVDFGFDRGAATVTAMTWGDVSMAYRSTRIPNIETFLYLSDGILRKAKMGRYLAPMTALAPVREYLLRQLGPATGGPSPEERAAGHSYVWIEATDAAGNSAQARLRTPHAYTLTAMASVEAAFRAASGGVAHGFQTPATAFGPEFVLQFADTELQDV
jgi:short subunit dehydrogenase-like uncharacterized protein